VHLLDTMKVLTVAEGVETATQFAYLKSLGVDACQGYLFSRPVPGADLLDVMCSEIPDGHSRIRQLDRTDPGRGHRRDQSPQCLVRPR
jgi:predicted signal transduction protein with EAL and GGDEF domain